MFIAINNQGIAIYVMSVSVMEKLTNCGADFSGMPLTVDPYMSSQFGVSAYKSDDNYTNGKYWYNGSWVDMPKTFWAVFNPTQDDFDNSFIYPRRSLDGKRYVFKRWNPSYTYQGTGSHNEGSPIAATEITPEELLILEDSNYFSESDFNKDNRLLKSDNDFAITQIEWSKKQILDAEATLQEKSAAIALCTPVLTYLNYGFISPAYAALAGITPAGAFTSEMKSGLMSQFATYLNKFPR